MILSSVVDEESYHYLRVRELVLELVKRQKGTLLSIRTVRRFLLEYDLKVKSEYIREIFLTLQMKKDYEGEDGQKERYKIPDTLSNA